MDSEKLLLIQRSLESGEQIPPDCEDTLLELVSRHLEPSPRRRFFFVEDGAGWIVGEESSPHYIRSTRNGYRFIRLLLRNPRKQIPAVKVFHLGRVDNSLIASMFKENEKARSNVSQQIGRAIKQIEMESPVVGAHLRRRIHTGGYLVYLPDPGTQPEWFFTWEMPS